MRKEVNRCPRSPDGRHYLVLLKDGRIICEFCEQRFDDVIKM
jgi:hypothetical protein